MHAQLSSGAGGMFFVQRFPVFPYFVYKSSESSGGTVMMLRHV